VSVLDTPSLVTATVDDLHDPVLPGAGADHRQAVLDAGCFHVVEVGGAPTSTVVRPLRVLAANLERGNHLDAWIDLFTAADADVVLVSEADGGMARSGNRYVARDLADRLGMQFAFAVEFVELGLGGPKERAALPEGARNEFGVHGGAVLSRVGLERPAAVRLEFDGSWFADDSPERRVGGRCAVVATVGGLVVVAPHLESHGGPRGRARQLADLLDVVDGYAEGRPVVLGGDLNTHTLDLRGEDAHDGQDATADGAGDEFPDERFVRPFDHEPLFAAAGERGYQWEAANTDEPTHRTEDRGGPVRGRLNLDWFLTRGVRASDPEVIPALDRDGQAISDHDVLAVTIDAA
jgi:endonuclease/exonuclease/phosphatase family metal-dependent hydrolase